MFSFFFLSDFSHDWNKLVQVGVHFVFHVCQVAYRRKPVRFLREEVFFLSWKLEEYHYDDIVFENHDDNDVNGAVDIPEVYEKYVLAITGKY